MASAPSCRLVGGAGRHPPNRSDPTGTVRQPTAVGATDLNCIRQTGSRIRQRDAKTACNGQPGRSYSKDDLDRTGQPSLAEALRTLDPSIR